MMATTSTTIHRSRSRYNVTKETSANAVKRRPSHVAGRHQAMYQSRHGLRRPHAAGDVHL